MSRLALFGLAVCTACVSSGPRPVRPAVEEVIDAPVGVVRAAALQAVTNLGLPLRSAEEVGWIETAYVDIGEYRPEVNQYPPPERIVRFSVAVAQDPNSAGAIVAIRAVYNPFRSGLAETRRGERSIPSSHPAMEVVRELLAELRKHAGRG